MNQLHETQKYLAKVLGIDLDAGGVVEFTLCVTGRDIPRVTIVKEIWDRNSVPAYELRKFDLVPVDEPPRFDLDSAVDDALAVVQATINAAYSREMREMHMSEFARDCIVTVGKYREYSFMQPGESVHLA